jgi:urease accessory protein
MTTLRVTDVLGREDDDVFTGRLKDYLSITWAEASRRRFRGTTRAGRDIVLIFQGSTFLSEGFVVHDDGQFIVVIERTLEKALVVDLPEPDAENALAQSVLLGHFLGNQHAPVDVSQPGMVLVPLMTGRETAISSLAALGFTARSDVQALARYGWDGGASPHDAADAAVSEGDEHDSSAHNHAGHSHSH